MSAAEALESMKAEMAALIAERNRLRAALQDVSSAYQQHFDAMPVAWQTIDHIVSAALDGAK